MSLSTPQLLPLCLEGTGKDSENPTISVHAGATTKPKYSSLFSFCKPVSQLSFALLEFMYANIYFKKAIDFLSRGIFS